MLPRDIPISPVDVRSSHHTVILPGFIDVHVHMRSPGQEHKEDWDTGTAAALAGGFTIVCAMPNTNPPVVDSNSLALASRIASENARCDYGLYVGASASNTSQLAQLSESAVALKVYLDQTFSTLQLNGMWFIAMSALQFRFLPLIKFCRSYNLVRAF